MSNKMELQELEKRYTELGGKLNHYQLKKKFAEADALAEQEHEFEAAQLAMLDSKRPGWSKSAGEWAGKGLSYVSMAFTFIFVLGGLAVGTIVLIAAELMAVYVGFAVMDSERALLYSVALVLFYIVVLFIQEMIIDKKGYHAQEQFSLRLLWQKAVYFIGIGKEWQMHYQELPSAQKNIAITVKLSTWAIIIFGVLGRLDSKLELLQNKTWYEAIQEIATKSNLTDMAGYIGMFIVTWALLWSIKWIVVFIYEQFRKTTGGVVLHDFSNASIVIMSPVQRIEASRAKVLEREIMRLESGKQKAK